MYIYNIYIYIYIYICMYIYPLETLERVLSTGEPCACECVTLLQSSHRGALSIYWYNI